MLFAKFYVPVDIKLSKEHSEFLFRDVKKIKNPDKYEKIAKKVVEKLKND